MSDLQTEMSGESMTFGGKRVNTEWTYRVIQGLLALLTFLGLFWLKGSFVSVERYDKDRKESSELAEKRHADDIEQARKDREQFKTAIENMLKEWKLSVERSNDEAISENRKMRETVDGIRMSLATAASVESRLSDHEARLRRNTEELLKIMGKLNVRDKVTSPDEQ